MRTVASTELPSVAGNVYWRLPDRGADTPPTVTFGFPRRALVVTTIGPATPLMLMGSVFTGVILEKPIQLRPIRPEEHIAARSGP